VASWSPWAAISQSESADMGLEWLELGSLTAGGDYTGSLNVLALC